MFDKFLPDEGTKKRQALHSLALHPSESSLLAGSVAFVFWIDIDTKSTLRKFSAHQGNVTTLQVFRSSAGSGSPYALSGGAGDKDRVLSVWKLDTEGGHDSPTTLLDANDSVSSVSLFEDTAEDCWILGAVTKAGMVQCFEFDPEGSKGRKKGRPVRPKGTIQVPKNNSSILYNGVREILFRQIASEKDSSGKVTSVPVIATKVSDEGGSNRVHLVHGSHAKPTFESVDYAGLNKVTCLVRTTTSDPGKKQLGAKVMVRLKLHMPYRLR